MLVGTEVGGCRHHRESTEVFSDFGPINSDEKQLERRSIHEFDRGEDVDGQILAFIVKGERRRSERMSRRSSSLPPQPPPTR